MKNEVGARGGPDGQTQQEAGMKTKRKKHYKEVRREKIICLRLSREEFLRIKADSLRDRTPVARMVRDKIADLIGGGRAG